MKSFLAVLLCICFGGPLFAADTPAKAGGPFEGGAVMNVRDKANCKLAIRLAARIQHIKGQITRDELRTVLNATDNREAMSVVNDHIQDMVLEQSFSGQKAGPRAAGGWLQWIIDNFPAILQMVMQIIALLSQNLPADGMQFCTVDAAEMELCRGGCSGGQCSPTPAAEAPIATPMPDQGISRSVVVKRTGADCLDGSPFKGEALFSPCRGNWWDRGPVRRLVSTPWRGEPRARR